MRADLGELCLLNDEIFAFNSLFEMPTSRSPVAAAGWRRSLSILYLRCVGDYDGANTVVELSLSILYLRCYASDDPQEVIKRVTFNSLFEMRVKWYVAHYVLNELVTFNSLFEMLVYHNGGGPPQRAEAFNSLFEMLPRQF